MVPAGSMILQTVYYITCVPLLQATPDQTMYNIRHQALILPPDFSPAARDFIMQALQKDPERRPTMQQLMEHPWVMLAGRKRASSLASDLSAFTLQASGDMAPSVCSL